MSIHSSFKFQGRPITSTADLLEKVQGIDEPSFVFLSEWFNDESFVLVRTSGSTGKPKQIKLQKQHMIASAEATGSYFNCLEGTKALNCLSAEFIAGKMMWVRALTLGWNLDLTSASGNPLTDKKSEYDFAAMVPMQVEKCLNQLRQIKKLIVGGAPVSSKLHKKLQSQPTQVFETYGMTETITHIAVKKLNHVRGESYFHTLPQITISLDDRECLCISAPNVSEEVVVTNDVVKLHSEVTFEWLGRYDSIINSGGIKLIPERIEAKLEALIPFRFFISALPNTTLGEQVILIIETEQDMSILQKIKASEVLSKYEFPKKVFFVPKFKETVSGKVNRIATKALLNN